MDVYEVAKPDGSKGHGAWWPRATWCSCGAKSGCPAAPGDGRHGKGMPSTTPSASWSRGCSWRAGSIERLDDKRYQVEEGRFTLLRAAEPAVGVLHLQRGHRGGRQDPRPERRLQDQVGARLLHPHHLLPDRSEDQRSTGFLFPHFGYSSHPRATRSGSGFFWAMGRSLDQTFYADHYSQIGYGFGHELRYAADTPSRGTFRTYVFNPTVAGGALDYDLDWNALQILPGNVRATVNVRQYSNLLFQQRFQDNFNLASTPHAAGVLRPAAKLRLRHRVQPPPTPRRPTSATTPADQPAPAHGAASGASPSLSAAPASSFGFDATRGEPGPGRRGRWSTATPASTSARACPARSPLSFLQFTPRASYRYTRWGDELYGGLGRPEHARRAGHRPHVLRGRGGPAGAHASPASSRRREAFYTERFKHVIGPEINWTYRTRVDDFDIIPKFDGNDYFLGTNEVELRDRAALPRQAS